MNNSASHYKHPIYTGLYIVPTLAIDETLGWMRNLVDNRIPGGTITSNPRYGKSRACRYAMACRLGADENNRFLIYLFVCPFETRPNENIFFEALLAAVGYDIITGRNPREKRERLIGYLVQEVTRNDTNRIVIIIDESQKMQFQHYQWLMDVYNGLDMQGIALTVLLVGQTELHHMRNLFIRTQKMQIVGRFMVHDMWFPGIRNAEDMWVCLDSYDTVSRYPLEEGPTFTQFFFPELYSRGFRLSLFANQLFEIFQDIRTQTKIKDKNKTDIPMQYVTLAIEYFLKNFGVYGEESPEQFGKAHWQDAVKASGFASAEILSTRKMEKD